MAETTLVKTRIRAGIWEGVLNAKGDDAPDIEVLHLGERIKSIDVSPAPNAPGTFAVKIAIPPDLLSDGVQTFVIRDVATGDKLDTFAVVTGVPLEDDIRAEIDLLRAELDMLKRAFRRHCRDTM